MKLDTNGDLYKTIEKRARKYWYKGIDADDLVQDICLSILSKKDNFEPSVNSVAFATGCVKNQVKIKFRKKKLDSRKKTFIDEYERYADPTESYYNKMLSDEYMSVLTSEEKQILRLSYWENRTAEEIGKIVNKHPSNIPSIKSKIIQKIRDCFGLEVKYYDKEQLIIRDLHAGVSFNKIIKTRQTSGRVVKRLAKLLNIKSPRTAKKDISKEDIISKLKFYNGNILRSSKALSIAQDTLNKKLKKYNIDIKQFRSVA